MTDIAHKIGADMQSLGGFLACSTCGHQTRLGSVGDKLAHGWPKCCGYTMTWWTQRQIDAGEAPPMAAHIGRGPDV